MLVLICVLLFCTQTFALEELTVMPGKDATLHSGCSSEGEVTLIEWTRSDLPPLKYVFLYRHARSYENYQSPYYRGRVELSQDGDVSITVKNVSVGDSGIYKCRTVVMKSENKTEFRRDINLRVTHSSESEGQKSLLVWNKEAEDEENKDAEKSEEGKLENSVLIAGVSVAVGFVCVGIIVLVLSKMHETSKERVPCEGTGHLI